MTYVQIMQSIPRDQWALENLQFPEVHLLHCKAVAAARQDEDTDQRADIRAAARGAGRCSGLGTRRVRHYGTGWPEGVGDGAAGSQAVEVDEIPLYEVLWRLGWCVVLCDTLRALAAKKEAK